MDSKLSHYFLKTLKAFKKIASKFEELLVKSQINQSQVTDYNLNKFNQEYYRLYFYSKTIENYTHFDEKNETAFCPRIESFGNIKKPYEHYILSFDHDSKSFTPPRLNSTENFNHEMMNDAKPSSCTFIKSSNEQCFLSFDQDFTLSQETPLRLNSTKNFNHEMMNDAKASSFVIFRNSYTKEYLSFQKAFSKIIAEILKSRIKTCFFLFFLLFFLVYILFFILK